MDDSTTKRQDTAREIFDLLGDQLPLSKHPRWDKQPQRIQDIFLEMARPGNRTYHKGRDLVFLIRGDGSLVAFQPMSQRDQIAHGGTLIEVGAHRRQLSEDLVKAAERVKKAEAEMTRARRKLAQASQENLKAWNDRRELLWTRDVIYGK